MDKIYKDYEDQYIANNIVYAPTLDSEYKLIHEKKVGYGFASEEPCIRNGKLVSAVKIDKDTLLDRVLKGAVVCFVDPPNGIFEYFIPVSVAIRKMSNKVRFTDIIVSNLDALMTVHLVSSEAILEELGNSPDWSSNSHRF